MTIINHLRRTILFIAWIPLLQLYSQPLNLVVGDTTITAAASFVARNSITAGPNFRIGATGDATMRTGGSVYMKPGIAVAQSGKLRIISDASLVVDVRTPQAPMPADFTLQQNYPNPFNPSTTIRFALNQRSRVSLIVFNVLGQPVRALVNDELPAGEHEARFSPEGLPSGVYMYRISTDGFVQSRRMLLLK